MGRIHYKLITTLYSPPEDYFQCNNFSPMIKNKVDGYAYVNLDQNNNFSKYELTSKIAQVACIPQETIVDIYFYSKIYISERKNYTQSFTNVYFDEFDSLIITTNLIITNKKEKYFMFLLIYLKIQSLIIITIPN